MRLKRASLLTKLVITVLLIYMATSLLDLWGRFSLPRVRERSWPFRWNSSAWPIRTAGRHRKQRRS